MFGLGAGELLIILVFALLFIGPKRLPELAKSMGKAFRSFNDAKNELVQSIESPSPHKQQSTDSIEEESIIKQNIEEEQNEKLSINNEHSSAESKESKES